MISLFIHYLSKIADWQSKSQFLKLFFNQRIFFRGLHVVGHGKILHGVSFSSSTQNNKFDWKWNPRESWNYFIPKHCVILARSVISKHSAILARNRNIPKEIHFRRHFDIVCWIELSIIRSLLPIEPTSSLFTQPDKRTNEFGNRTCSVFIRPTCLMLGLNKKCEATLTLPLKR